MENGVLKIQAKSLKDIWEGVLLNNFYLKSKIIQKITLMFTLYISDFSQYIRRV